jgi:hypothetical protein
MATEHLSPTVEVVPIRAIQALEGVAMAELAEEEATNFLVLAL